MRRAALAALDAGASRVVVVTGANAREVSAVLLGLQGVGTCFNPEWESGISSSLAAGLRALDDNDDVDAVLVTLVDQPHVTAEPLTRLLAAFQSGHRLVAAEYNGVIGVPAVFGTEFFRELCELQGDSGAGVWLRARISDVKTIPVLSAALDIDTPDDLQALDTSVPTTRRP